MSGMNLEVWFPQQNEVSVFLESSYPDPDEERFYETCLFALYAARQIASLGPDGDSLAFVLQTTDTSNPLPQTVERLDEVRLVAPRWAGRGGGRKGFTCELRPDKRAFFKLHLHGFGMMGRGVSYYAPTSTLALLYWLLDRRKDDPLYQRALAATAENVGILGMQGSITVTSQAPLAMEAATAAWVEAREHAGEVSSFEPSPDAQTACAEYGINFASLLSGASGRLHETLTKMEGKSGHILIEDGHALRTCQLEVLIAAGLATGLERPFAAIQAAEASGDPATIDAATDHYERTLADLIDEHELEPLVEELRGHLFTRDARRAAEF
jgi:hypothetical protein